MTASKAAPNILFGQAYRDKVSGFEGIATGVYEFLNGCVRVELSHKDDKGAPVGFVFDQEQLEPSKGMKGIDGRLNPGPPTGGPRDSSPVSRH